MTQLVKPQLTIERARVLLAECGDLEAVRRIKNVATAIETLARAEKAARETIVEAQEIQTRALRRGGELTLTLPKRHRGRRKPGQPDLYLLPSKREATEAAGWDHNAVHLAEKLARLPEADFEAAIVRAREDGTARARSVVGKARAHVSNATGHYEWYSPPELVDSSRKALGGTIDVDPASSEAANEIVRAKTFYTAEQSGLAVKVWNGTVYGNPPYLTRLITDFTDRLVQQVKGGWTTAAVWVTNNATETEWGSQLIAEAHVICFPKKRIAFLDETGKPRLQPLQGQMVSYFGDDPRAFRNEFTTHWGPCR